MSARGPIRRTIIRLVGDVVAVGSQQDYERAKNGEFGPYLIGFPVSDIIEENGLDSLVLLKHNVQYEQVEHSQAGADSRDDERGEQPPRDHPNDRRVD